MYKKTVSLDIEYRLGEIFPAKGHVLSRSEHCRFWKEFIFILPNTKKKSIQKLCDSTGLDVARATYTATSTHPLKSNAGIFLFKCLLYL